MLCQIWSEGDFTAFLSFTPAQSTHLACQVYLLFRDDRVMSREDPEASKIVEASFKKDGIILCAKVTTTMRKSDLLTVTPLRAQTNFLKVSKAENEKTLHVMIDGNSQDVPVDEILVVTGRKPNVKHLGLKRAGVKYDSTKGVEVTDLLVTSNSNVYAGS